MLPFFQVGENEARNYSEIVVCFMNIYAIIIGEIINSLLKHKLNIKCGDINSMDIEKNQI